MNPKFERVDTSALSEGIVSAKPYNYADQFKEAAEQGDSEAQYDLADTYSLGLGVQKDVNKAIKWYRKAAEQGHTKAQYELAQYYVFGKGVKQDFTEAAKWYGKAADEGNSKAQFSLGLMYAEGIGVSQDYAKAVEWYRRAAEQGNAGAQNNLGLLYYIDQGPQDHAKAAEWFRKAAEQGNAGAQGNLGEMYYKGQGVPRDHKKAIEWLRKAAEQRNSVALKHLSAYAEKGDVDAQFNLGEMYFKGQGVPQNHTKALEWFRKAAEQGFAAAQCNLGLIYGTGKVVPQNHKKAVEWFRKAAEQGYAEAQFYLGFMYYIGHGVIEDYIEAYKWALLASSNGYNVSEVKENIMKQMTTYQIAEAQRLAKAFVPKSAMTGDKEDVLANDRLTPKSSGTGFFISSDGYVITAAHVVEDATKIKVLTQEGLLTAKLHTKLVTEDVAVLKIDVKGYSALPIKSSREIKIGAEVFTVGFPNIGLQGFEPKFTKGNISSMAGMQDDPKHFQISVPIQPGNSGGPLVDEWGNVVGVVVAKLSEKTTMELTGSLPQNVNYALKSSFILALLESIGDIGNKMPKPHTKEELSFENIVEKVRNSVVLILVY